MKGGKSEKGATALYQLHFFHLQSYDQILGIGISSREHLLLWFDPSSILVLSPLHCAFEY